jgi:putative glutamine amidotransferase
MTQSRQNSTKPVILISCDAESYQDRRGEGRRRFLCDADYARAVLEAGGVPLLVPYLLKEDVTTVLSRAHGLVISGGDFDVPPHYYGEQPSHLIGNIVEDRSASEKALVEQAMALDMPILGICGGMQLINVVLGGTLYQDLSLRPQTQIHQQEHRRSLSSHAVALTAGSKLEKLFGSSEVAVNSTHHQVIKNLGKGVVASGHADDGVVESLEADDLSFCLGVQWHPEALESSHRGAIYGGLIAAARVFLKSVGAPASR